MWAKDVGSVDTGACIELLVAVERDKLFASSLIYMPRYINNVGVMQLFAQKYNP
jgi:hypothetical protein